MSEFKIIINAKIKKTTYSLEGCRATNCATRANYDIYK